MRATRRASTSMRRISVRSSGGWNWRRSLPAGPILRDSWRPAGIPESFDEHVKLHFDLQALAFRGDMTRVSTVLYARDLTARTFRKAALQPASMVRPTMRKIRKTSNGTRTSISTT